MSIGYLWRRMTKSKISIVIMIGVICITVLLFYFSFALFTSSDERRGTLNIVTGNLYSLIESPSFNHNNEVTILPREQKELTITLTNINEINARFNLFYSSYQDLTNVRAGYLPSGDSAPDEQGYILYSLPNYRQTKTINVRIENESDNVVTIAFGSNAGLSNHPTYFPTGKFALRLFEETICNHNILQPIIGNESLKEWVDKVDVIVLEDNINAPTEAVVWDVSINQDRSVIAFIHVSERTYLYIQANGRICTPEDSSLLFSNFPQTVKFINLELLDTSRTIIR